MLDSIDTLGGNKLKFHWDHHHPITTYLIAVAAYDYVIIERNFMGYPLIYYAMPGYESVAQTMLDSCEIVLAMLDTLIAPYPFADEKFGQCHAYGTGAMEHQTCIEYGANRWDNPITHAHEMIHQWYGNDVTCINYGNMFLNEGTTEYYECLSILLLRGVEAYKDGLEYRRNEALITDNIYHQTIINNPNPFHAGCVYYKGSWFHHMLRNLMGDSLYFPAMREYYQLFRGGNVSITDLQNVIESYYQDSLEWFFHQWLEETDHPLLNIIWIHDNDTLKVNICQVQTFGPSVFKIPVELGVWSGGSYTVYGPYWMEDSANLAVSIVCSEPDSITVDPELKLYFKLDDIITENYLLLVDDDGGGSFQGKYTEIFDLIGLEYYSWDCNQQGLPPDLISNNVKAVLWITGDEVDPLSQADRDKIGTIIDNDVPIAIFSPGAVDQLQGTSFLNDTLGCTFTGSTTNITEFTGQGGDPIGDGGVWYTLPVHSSFTLTPNGSGVGCVYWDTAGYGVVRNDQMNLVFSTVDLKYIYNMTGYQTRKDLIVRILNHQGLNVPVEEIEQQPVVYQPNTLDIRYISQGLIRFTVTVDHPTQLCIYDITGRIVQRWDIEGERVIEWRGEDIDGRILPGGRYFAVMSSNLLSRQIILLK